MRILVTGATGFVGRYVVAQLADMDFEIIAVYQKAKPREDSKLVNWVCADLLNENERVSLVKESRADVMIHLAWYAEHGRFWTANENFDWCLSTVRLFRDFVSAGGRRAVFAGTCAEYDWRYGYCTEGITPTNPSSTYGEVKDATRRLIASFADNNEIEWAWGRIFLPFGIGEANGRLLTAAINTLASGKPLKCTHGEQFRDFIAVEDAASALIHLCINTNECGEFNICSGIPTRLSDLINFCGDRINPNVRIQLGALEVPSDDPPLLVGNCDRLKASGWKMKYDIKYALSNMVDNILAETRSNR